MTTRFGPIDYRVDTVPKTYRCSKCRAHDVKLWRQYQTFADCIELMCAACALKDQGKEGPVDRFGRRTTEYGDGTDQIGWLVPAIPDEGGDTFCGYTSVPEDGVRWWVSLPTKIATRKGKT